MEKKGMSLNINFNYNYPQVAREAGFKLRQFKDGPLDWRLLGALDLERIQREQHFEQVDGVLAHISEVPLASMLETNILDSGIAKYFMLSQFAVQYLLFCRKFLDETVTDLREAYAASQMELARLKKSQAEANNEILQLHKKITQIEAIHEVVYPCHLCSKSFVSNEALNIHISRKHSSKLLSDGILGGRLSVSTPLTMNGQRQQEKVDDLHLINTIKLELEIKQLKERLNVAEREIRERSATNSKRPTPRELQPQLQQQQQPQHETTSRPVQLKSVGIQSNLMEAKEQDETSDSTSPTIVTEREVNVQDDQVMRLQDKVREFDEWRESLRTHNEASISEINKKLGELTRALAESVQMKQTANTAIDRRPSISNLEQILMQKITEIGQASAEKLEQVVYHMELNYKEKLDELEKEIKKKNVERNEKVASPKKEEPPKSINTTTSQKRNLQRTQTLVERHTETEDDDEALSQRETAAMIRVKRSTADFEAEQNTSKPKTDNEKEKANDDTYEIEELPANKPTKSAQPQKPSIIVLGSLSTEESNQTFVKAVEPAKPALRNERLHTEAENESTDVSESLEDESTSTNTSDEAELQIHELDKPSTLKAIERPKTAKSTREPSPKRAEPEKVVKKHQSKPKQFTRKDAKKLAQRKLQHLGIDTGIKNLSITALKKSTAVLNDERNKLKQKYPHFYATRNKLKKLVDKLCSSKLPDNAEVMLKSTRPLHPVERHRQHLDSAKHTVELDDNSFETPEPKSSTPREERPEKDAFKMRLENLLASPMRRPSNLSAAQKEHDIVRVDVHTKPGQMPVPVPRKRVMFDTGNTTDGYEASRFAF